MATKPKTKSTAKKKSAAKRKPAKKKTAAASKKRVPHKPAAAKKAAATLAKVESLVTAELERPKLAESVRALPGASGATETSIARSGGGVRNKDIILFMRQLIMMLEAGTPIINALKSLARRGERKGLRNLVAGICEYVEAGNPLWQAFARESQHFPSYEINLIKAAEAGGTLTAVLKRIAEYREQRDRLRKFVQIAMIYPAILTVVCLVLVIVLSTFVIPAFREIFDSMDVDLGWYSRFIMSAADIIAGFWWFGVIVVVGLIAFHELWWVKNPLRRLASDRVKLRIPLFGSITQRSVIADFTRTFAMLLRSGISMMATLDLCKNSMTNRAYISVIQNMRDSIETGEGLEAPLREAEKDGYFPGIVVDMLLTGEETGSLDTVAEQLSDIYSEEVEIAVNGLKEAITPIFVVGMGFIVGSIVIAMFLPLVNMIEAISGGAL